MAKKTPEQMKIIREYDRKTYQLVQFKPKVEEAERIKKYVQGRGESLTRFLVRAADTQMLIDGQTDAETFAMVEAAALESELLEELDLELHRVNSIKQE